MIKQIIRIDESFYQFYKNYTIMNTDYVVLSKSVLEEKIITCSICFCYLENDLIKGLISIKIDKNCGYISLLYGIKEVQIALLKYIEKNASSYKINELWNHFFNPITLEWYPLKDATHPGHPGVPLGTIEFEVYEQAGFSINSIQEVYYLDLKEFKCKNLIHPNKQFSVDYYDETRHKNYEKFADEIQAEHWKKVLINNKNKEKSLPMLVALDGINVIGFAGPLMVEEHHRGYFAGIGILKSYRGQQIGKYLFNNLCMQLKNIGALYMTLFTGESNSAKYIYKNAGFKVVKQFATMKKIL